MYCLYSETTNEVPTNCPNFRETKKYRVHKSCGMRMNFPQNGLDAHTLPHMKILLGENILLDVWHFLLTSRSGSQPLHQHTQRSRPRWLPRQCRLQSTYLPGHTAQFVITRAWSTNIHTKKKTVGLALRSLSHITRPRTTRLEYECF